MKKKILGIFVFMLLIATTLPAVGTTIKNENAQSIGDRGGIFRQYPSPLGDPMPEAWISDKQTAFRFYEDFWEVSGPICEIHWWGQAAIWNNT